MRKIYSFMLFAILSISAFAEPDGYYYWFYDEVKAEPTGKGKIYVSQDYVDEFETPIEYQESMELKVCVEGFSQGTLYTYEQPAEGYQFVGWYTADASKATLADKVSDGAYLDVTTTTASEDNLVEGYAPIPDATYYGIFAKVNVQVLSSMKTVGSVDISKVANDTGDQVTITATPNDDKTRFEYWENRNGDQIKENPYTFTVADEDTYTAHFSGDNIKQIDFGEGKYIPFSNELSAKLSDGIYVYEIISQEKAFWDEEDHLIRFDETENAWGWVEEEYDEDWNLINSIFHKYEGEIPDLPTYAVSPSVGNGYMAGNGAILYGEGVQTIVLYEDESAYVSDMSKLTPTCGGAVDIASLPVKDDDENAITYYVLQGNAFVKATSGTVAKDQCYLALTATDSPLPEKVYINPNDDPADIQDINVESAPQFNGIYTIDGKQVVAPVKGINIIGNRKVWVKQ